jgi:phosphoserine phosphatase RsbU/P
VVDISQRQIAEARLRDSEALYHSLVETLPQNIFRKDLQGRFTFANQQFCRALGRKLEEIVGKTDFDFFPAELAAKYQQDDRQIIATGTVYECVEEHQPPGQEKMYVQVVKTPLYGADGLPVGLQGIFWDITSQRKNERDLLTANMELTQSRETIHARNVQMEEDLKMAREIQLTLLPQHSPDFRATADQAASSFVFTHRYLPTGSVGGDFFAISEISRHQAGVFFCDVAGHGVRAALVTAMIRALVEELKPCAEDPGLFLTRLNSELCSILKHTGTPVLTTAFYLVADCASDTIRYANAGHPKPWHVRRQTGAAQTLRTPHGKPQAALGLFEKVAYTSAEIAFVPGDFLFLYTDGLVEVHSKEGELYSSAQLASALQRHSRLPAGELLDELLKEVRDFSDGGFADDVCLLGVDYAMTAKGT